MSETKRIRIVSNGRTNGGTQVFIGDEDVTNNVLRVTWTIGVDEVSRATVTFARAEVDVMYMATETPIVPTVFVAEQTENATVVPADYFDELKADLDAPPEPNERVREAARRLRDVVRLEEA